MRNNLVTDPFCEEVFLVTDVIDEIPAPVGSLRWAIEQSEANNEPDSIVFVIDGGTIGLVAPIRSAGGGASCRLVRPRTGCTAHRRRTR